MARAKIREPKHVTRIIQAIEDGATYEDAAAEGPISKQTFWNWMNRGEEIRSRIDSEEISLDDVSGTDDGLYVDFFDRVKIARSVSCNSAIRSIKKAWVGEYVRKETVERVTDKDGNVTETVVREYFKPEWTAAAWYLERTRTDDFGRRQVIKHQGDSEEPVVVKVVDESMLAAPWLTEAMSKEGEKDE